MDELGKRDRLTRWKPTIAYRSGDRVDYMEIDSLRSRLSFSPIDVRAGWRLTKVMLRSTPDNFDPHSLVEADEGLSTAEWGPEAVGSDAYEYAVRAAVEPFWGAPPEHVPAAAARGVLGSSLGQKLLQLPGGTGSLCGWLVGEQFEGGCEVERVEAAEDGYRVHLAGGNAPGADGSSREADGVVLATDAHVATGLFGDLPAASTLGGASYASNLHVALAFDSEPWPEEAGDLVFEVGPGERTITSYAPLSRRRPQGLPAGSELIDVYFGDRASRRLAERREEAVELAVGAVERYLGISLPEPRFIEAIFQPRALSVPRPGELAARPDLGLPAGLAVAGDHAAMAAVETAVRSGEAAATKLLAEVA